MIWSSIGVAVRPTTLHAVVGRRGRVLQRVARERTGPAAFEDDLVALLRAVRRHRFTIRRVTIALGPHDVSVKRLTGLPRIGDPAVVQALVCANRTRFLLAAGNHSTVAQPVRTEKDWWIAAYDAVVVTACERACARAGLALRAVVPSLWVVAADGTPGASSWDDGERTWRFHLAGGHVQQITQVVPAVPQQGGRPVVPIALPQAPNDFPREALAAIRLHAFRQLALRPGQSRRARRFWRAVTVASALLAASSLAAVALGPSVAAQREISRLRETLRSKARAITDVTAGASASERESRILEGIEQFARSRHSKLRVLGALTSALPESTAIASFRADSTGGTLVALAVNGPGVVTAISELPGFTQPRLIGPIIRETGGATTLDRLTIGFRWVPSTGRPPRPMVGALR